MGRGRRERGGARGVIKLITHHKTAHGAMVKALRDELNAHGTVKAHVAAEVPRHDAMRMLRLVEGKDGELRYIVPEENY